MVLKLLNQLLNSRYDLHRSAEQKFLQCLQTIPNYYNPFIKKNLTEQNIQQIQKSLLFLIEETSHLLYMQKVKTYEAKIFKVRKIIDEDNFKIRQSHISKNSYCCAFFSDNYQARFQIQMNCEFRYKYFY
ncbi:unnamed protein product [Paramecium sonneborni]|uniref:Uncharacterized protein n=1 Tax=Paramecium sonneborni TaxID=65129 RepID=A0A8S1MW09_9CILI|nr:unnamed protein product [Paramecium sonneborni]